MKQYNFCHILLIAILSFLIITGKESDQETEQLTTGHLTLPTSQEPGPLFGFEFGQNIVDKGDIQFFLYPFYVKGNGLHFNEVTPNFLYGIRDDLSLFMQLPFVTKYRQDECCSAGAQDLMIQFEYAFYNNDYFTASDQATVIANITLPTGSPNKNPALGTGSPTFFLGFSASHTSPNWYVWINPGVILTTPHKGTKTGNQFPYQFGVARNLAYSSSRWILSLFLEFNGEYVQRTMQNGVCTPNTGGHSLFVGPSLWFSTNRFILQAGISWPIHQHLFGNQNETTYMLALNAGWKFN